MVTFEWIIGLLLGAVALSALAQRINVPYPTLLAIGGALLPFIPSGPSWTLEPDLALALFVAPVLVLLSYVVGPAPMTLQFWPGAVTMVMIATVTATFITNSGRTAWFVGALLIFIYAIFAMTLYIVPPLSQTST